MSNILIGTDKSRSFRFYLTITTEMAETARKIHDLSPLAAAGLGRVLTGTGLMSVMMKNDTDRLTVQFKGDGPAKQIIACGYGDGRVRGYIAEPGVELPLTPAGKLDVGGSLGKGELTVIRDSGLKEPYVGTIALVSGEIAEDLTAYYYISEQQNTSFALGVKVGRERNVIAAGGSFIQMLPDADEEAVDRLEEMLRGMRPVTSLVEEAVLQGAGKTREGILETMMHNMFDVLGEDYSPQILGYKDTRWECDCSRERMAKALATIGRDELKAIIEEDGQAELGCQFCGRKYNFTEEELQIILEHAGGKA